jgi:signal transduction histidine kinase
MQILLDIFLFDYKNLLMSFALLINFILFLITLKGNKNYRYALHVFSVVGWVFAMQIFRYSSDLNTLRFIGIVLYFFGLYIPFTFLLFLLEYKKELFKEFQKYKIYIKFLFLLYFFQSLFIILNVNYVKNSEHIIVFNKFVYTYYLLLVNLFFFFAFYLIYIWIKKTVGVDKSQAKIIFYGSLMTVTISFFSNVLLPTFNVFTFNWIGQVSSIFLTSCVFYAILKYKLFDIKLFTSKFVKYLFYSVYAYVTFYGLTFLYENWFGSVVAKEALTMGIFIAPIFAYLIFRLDKVTDIINYFIFGNLNKHQDVLNAILDYININIEDDKIIKFIEEILTGFLEVKNVKILNLPSTNKALNQKIKDYFKKHREIYVCEDDKILKKNLGNIYCGVLFKIKTGNEFLFYCENKNDNARFSKEDLGLIRSVANQLEYVFNRTDLYKQVNEYNQELEKKVATRTAELQIQKRTLQSMLEEKEETLHIVSHQIKTPLTVINSAYEMWKDGLWTPDKTGQVVKTELDRMKDTMNIFFKAQQTDIQNKTLNTKINDLNVLLEELIKEKKMNKKVRDGEIALNLDEDFKTLSPFLFDSQNLTEVLSNVIDNAIIYTNKTIKISYKLHVIKDKNFINIIVKDDGIGIETKDLDRLFGRFVRSENAKIVKPDGNGLGLYVCKQIMQLMHGKIWAESEGSEKGSTFFISLPYVVQENN